MSLASLTSLPTSGFELSNAGVLGSTTPRLWTPPLVTGPPGPCGCGCALTPDTSYGFDVIEFARDQLHHPLDPWQALAAVHGGELLPDGRPRFRIVVILVARQNGKTELLVVLTLFWQFVEAQSMILGTSTKLDYAKESWTKSVRLAKRARALDALRPARWTRETNGEQESWTREILDDETGEVIYPECRYKIAASNEEGGRSLTVNRLILDELRQHRDYSAYDAAEPAASPWDAQIWALSNAGDDRSTVLNDLRGSALEFIKSGEGDPRLGLLEWSAEEHADPEDIHALAAANPNLGRRGTDVDTLLAAARRAKAKGGKALAGFRTERMCIRVRQMNPAINPVAWTACLDVGDLAAARSRVALCLDVAPDGLHATLTAAAVLPDDRVRVEPVKAWAGPACLDELRRELPGELARVKPQVLGWFPAGPAAAIAADLRRRPGWPPAGIRVEEIKGDTAAVCMGLDEQVTAIRIAHSGDPLQDAHIAAAERLFRGPVWVFSRKTKGVADEVGHCDAAYAAAGAVHLARTLPPKPRAVVVVGRRRASSAQPD